MINGVHITVRRPMLDATHAYHDLAAHSIDPTYTQLRLRKHKCSPGIPRKMISPYPQSPGQSLSAFQLLLMKYASPKLLGTERLSFCRGSFSELEVVLFFPRLISPGSSPQSLQHFFLFGSCCGESIPADWSHVRRFLPSRTESIHGVEREAVASI